MMMKHLLLEVICDCEMEKKLIPDYCKLEPGLPTEQCFSNNCKYLSYTYTEDELVYVNEHGIVESKDFMIGFGAEMEADNEETNKKLKNIWKNICKEKIQEAYSEYMIIKNEISD